MSRASSDRHAWNWYNLDPNVCLVFVLQSASVCVCDNSVIFLLLSQGVIQSTKNSRVKWSKQILHVWSTSHQVTQILALAYTQLDAGVKANTIVMVTTATNAEYIFKNPWGGSSFFLFCETQASPTQTTHASLENTLLCWGLREVWSLPDLSLSPILTLMGNSTDKAEMRWYLWLFCSMSWLKYGDAMLLASKMSQLLMKILYDKFDSCRRGRREPIQW